MEHVWVVAGEQPGPMDPPSLRHHAALSRAVAWEAAILSRPEAYTDWPVLAVANVWAKRGLCLALAVPIAQPYPAPHDVPEAPALLEEAGGDPAPAAVASMKVIVDVRQVQRHVLEAALVELQVPALDATLSLHGGLLLRPVPWQCGEVVYRRLLGW